MTRQLLWCVPLVGMGVVAGVGADRLAGAPDTAKQDVKQAVSLPVTRVVLFTASGTSREAAT